MPEAILEIRDLVKRYGSLTALDGVSLDIRPGEIFGLLGPNGAGKTTLIGAVCGLVRKTSGGIKLFGIDLDEDPVTPRFQVGLVPQEINFDPFFTVEESLQIQLGYYSQRADPARIDEVLRALNLQQKAKAPTRALSGGMKRRLLIAKALVHRPRLVFLDEPTAGVDVELRRDLWSYVRKLKAEGTTIILTTHYLEEAEALADRVAVLGHGKLIASGTVDQIRAHVSRKTVLCRTTLAMDAICGWAGVDAVESVAGQVQITTRDAESVLRRLLNDDREVRDIEVRRAGLAEAFAEITSSSAANGGNAGNLS